MHRPRICITSPRDILEDLKGRSDIVPSCASGRGRFSARSSCEHHVYTHTPADIRPSISKEQYGSKFSTYCIRGWRRRPRCEDQDDDEWDVAVDQEQHRRHRGLSPPKQVHFAVKRQHPLENEDSWYHGQTVMNLQLDVQMTDRWQQLRSNFRLD